MSYLFDENTPDHLVAYMVRLGASDLIHVRSHYGEGIRDDDLIPRFVADGHVWVTYDRRARQAYLGMLFQLNVKAIFLPSQILRGGRWEQGAFFLRHWRRLRTEFESLQSAAAPLSPCLALIGYDGRLRDVTANCAVGLAARL